jgi:hypothetical protein
VLSSVLASTSMLFWAIFLLPLYALRIFTLPSCLRRTVPSGLWCPGLRTRVPCVFLHLQNDVRLILPEDCSCHARQTSRKQCFKMFLSDLHKRVYNLL